jgi:hypothetical protein
VRAPVRVNASVWFRTAIQLSCASGPKGKAGSFSEVTPRAWQAAWAVLTQTAGARAVSRVSPVALHATTIRFADRAYMAIARAADAQGISVSQYVREAALIRVVLDELDTAEEAIHSAHDLLAVAREVRLLAEVDPPGPPRANAGRKRSASAKPRHDG